MKITICHEVIFASIRVPWCFMVSVLAFSVEGCGFDPWLGRTKDIKNVFAASLLSTNHFGVRSKTGWPSQNI